MYIKIFISFLAMVFFAACGASASLAKAEVESSKSWLTNPPADNGRYFYALGYGKTQKEAKSDALSTISTKISVDVASNFSSSLTATRYNDNEDVLSETKNEVVSKSKEIQYDNVKIIKSHKDAKEWVVLVEVDKDVLTKTYERKLSKIDKKLQSEWELYKEASFFEKLKLSVNIKKYLKETDAIFPLLYAINKNYDDSKYASRYIKYTKEMRKAETKMVFKIVADENSQSLASLIKTKLSEKNIVFSDKNYNVLIKITTKAKKRKYRSTNQKFANLTFALRKTNIKAIDKDGNIISNALYKTKSGSSYGFEDAIDRVSKYEKIIQNKGIIAFITGN